MVLILSESLITLVHVCCSCVNVTAKLLSYNAISLLKAVLFLCIVLVNRNTAVV